MEETNQDDLCVNIVSDGSALGTTVTDAKTGLPVPSVVAVKFDLRAGHLNTLAEITIVARVEKVEIMGAVAHTVPREIKTATVPADDHNYSPQPAPTPQKPMVHRHTVESVELTAEEQADRDFARLLFRNRRDVSAVLRGITLSLFEQQPCDDETMMFAIESRWKMADKRKANGED